MGRAQGQVIMGQKLPVIVQNNFLQKVRFPGTQIGSGTQLQAVKKKNCIPGKRK